MRNAFSIRQSWRWGSDHEHWGRVLGVGHVLRDLSYPRALASGAQLTFLSAPVRVMNRLRLTGTLPRTAFFGPLDLLVDPTLGAPAAVGALLVVDDLTTLHSLSEWV
jgi:hypothetical protein